MNSNHPVRDRRRTRIAALLLALVSAIGVSGLAAAPAQAGPATYGCPSGHVCFYKGAVTSSNPFYTTAGDIPAVNGVKSVFNNGNQQTGSDHVHLRYGTNGKACLHYYDGSTNTGPATFTFGTATNVKTESFWGGEC
ncbi:hypothetical protein [Glycomyces harbinensis]|uniref:Peptidase inhibitor family I36 n=1 Tax=Glycomyces harbinensis TaxID=58114 RepID=A0A1G6VM58_9ACTN|nr:hypothetical protein [Glycomyces harbinensis]SDD54624.1 hypothetical protein SAMN05216270_10520 [Glycomyces harbinensis]